MAPSLDDNYREMICLLNKHHVDYLLIGGWAISFHVAFRYTEDIDFWIRASPGNAANLMAALQEFGAPLHEITTEDFEKPQFGMHIGVPPCRIDLLTRVSGVDFDSAWESRVEARLGGEPIFVLGREDLIASKRAAGRPKDLRDLIQLQKVDK